MINMIQHKWAKPVLISLVSFLLLICLMALIYSGVIMLPYPIAMISLICTAWIVITGLLLHYITLQQNKSFRSAILSNDVSQLNRLIQTIGTDLNRRLDHYPLLTFAALKGCEKSVDALLAHNANPNLQNQYGNTALILAAQNGHTDIVNALLEKNADPNLQNQYGSTALTWAAHKLHSNIVRTLLAHQADPDMRDFNGNTALMWAIRKEHRPTAKALLNQGADPMIRDCEGNSPWSESNRLINSQIRQWFREELRQAKTFQYILSGGKKDSVSHHYRAENQTLLSFFETISGSDFERVKNCHLGITNNTFITLLGALCSLFAGLLLAKIFYAPLLIATILIAMWISGIRLYTLIIGPYPPFNPIDSSTIDDYLTSNRIDLHLAFHSKFHGMILLIHQVDSDGQPKQLAAIQWDQLDLNLRRNLQTYFAHKYIDLNFEDGRLHPNLKQGNSASSDHLLAQNLLAHLATRNRAQLETFFNQHSNRTKEYGFDHLSNSSENTMVEHATHDPCKQANGIDPTLQQDSEMPQPQKPSPINLEEALPFVTPHLDAQALGRMAQTDRTINKMITSIAPPIAPPRPTSSAPDQSNQTLAV